MEGSLGYASLQQKLEMKILEELGRRTIFTSLRQHDLDTFTEGESHKILLQKQIIRKFVNLRMRKIGRDKSMNLSSAGKSSKLFRSAIVQNL